MEPQEIYDARLEGRLRFEPATEVCGALEGPWQDLTERPAPFLTREPVLCQRFVGAQQLTRARDLHYCFPLVRLSHPCIVQANVRTSSASGVVCVFKLKKASSVSMIAEGLSVVVDGKKGSDGTWTLKAGKHLVVAMVQPLFGHVADKTLRIVDPPVGLSLHNPLRDHANPWALLLFPELDLAGGDLHYHGQQANREWTEATERWNKACVALAKESGAVTGFLKAYRGRMRCLSPKAMLMRDEAWRVFHGAVVAPLCGARGTAQESRPARGGRLVEVVTFCGEVT